MDRDCYVGIKKEKMNKTPLLILLLFVLLSAQGNPLLLKQLDLMKKSFQDSISI